ncbi:hypothetical protein BDQ12DRAFT_678335 [Crucibulum laeve]|uniref:Uncharacterized protein n=1 Tax=Crucibulum laeve TaxID=68775 RepID=A0A5C3MCV1_9AGAR|nr:hypothetical protein BDQ12DRAFT_678335 [Crucibulum laeve]
MIYLGTSGTHGLPLTFPSYSGSAHDVGNLCFCPDNEDKRSIWDIIWSCIATTFHCTWVTVHPNIPALQEEWWWVAWRRAKAMFWALLSPELVILWALRQWRSAKLLENRYKDRGWTIVHGHFFQMGGFILQEDGKPLTTLLEDTLSSLLKAGSIEFPTTTEDEINDKSKGIFSSKVNYRPNRMVCCPMHCSSCSASCIIRIGTHYSVSGGPEWDHVPLLVVKTA